MGCDAWLDVREEADKLRGQVWAGFRIQYWPGFLAPHAAEPRGFPTRRGVAPGQKCSLQGEAADHALFQISHAATPAMARVVHGIAPIDPALEDARPRPVATDQLDESKTELTI